MKKSKKILFLALSMSLAFSPINSMISNKANVAYAEDMMSEDKELSPEEFIQKAKDFVNSEEFKALPKKDQDEFKDLIKDLTPENLDQKKVDEILDAIDKIEVSYIGNKYQVLKKNVLSLKDNSLSKELQEDLSQYKDSYKTYGEYSSQIKKLNDDKKNIEDEKNNIKELKKILKKGLDDNKNSGVDLKDEEAIYNKKDASYDEVNNAIKSLNTKVTEHNKKEEDRQAKLNTLKNNIDKEVERKNSINYKKASQSLKDKFNQSLESIKSAYNKLNNKEEVNNVDVLVNAYDSAYNNLDGIKNEKEFNDKYEELKQYFEKNKNKLSKEDQEKFAKRINELPEKEDSNLESIKNLKAEIEIAIKKPQNANLKKVSRQVAVKKQPATKKSRSFVRTGVKSVGIVLVVLILAGAGYFLLSKKNKK